MKFVKKPTLILPNLNITRQERLSILRIQFLIKQSSNNIKVYEEPVSMTKSITLPTRRPVLGMKNSNGS